MKIYLILVKKRSIEIVVLGKQIQIKSSIPHPATTCLSSYKDNWL